MLLPVSHPALGYGFVRSIGMQCGNGPCSKNYFMIKLGIPGWPRRNIGLARMEKLGDGWIRALEAGSRSKHSNGVSERARARTEYKLRK